MNELRKKHKLLLKSAKTRGIKVKLNLKHYEELLQLGCMYCGIDLQSQNGYCLDRIDNCKGYTNDNVTPCCKECNWAKGTRNVAEFTSWVERVYNFQKDMLNKVNNISKNEILKSENIYMNSSGVRNGGILEYEP